MALNLIDAAKALFTSEVMSRASSQLGENESGISRALSGIIPTILMGLLNKIGNNDGAREVERMVRDQPDTGPGDLSSWLTPGNSDMMSKASGLMGGLFGGKSDLVSTLISNWAGVKSSTSNSLLSMAVPVILGLLRRNSSGSEPSAIASLLNSQRSNIQSAIPAGLNLGSIFGNLGDSVSSARTSATSYTTDAVKRKGMGPLLPILLLLGAALLAFLIFGKGCKRDAGTVVGDTVDSVTVGINEAVKDVKTWTGNVAGKFDSLTNEFVYDEGNRMKISLPNNAGSLEVGENSTENRLHRFLSDPNAKIDAEKGNWFEFTNVKFKTGSSDITDESLTQLKNLVMITKGYPNAKFKIGGYTDNTGSRETNIALSQKRADAVAAKLKELGAAAGFIVEAEGYGPEWPIADNGTAEGRAQNRRVAVNVKAK